MKTLVAAIALTLTGVAGVMEHAHAARKLFGEIVQNLGCGIRGPIIDRHQFGLEPFGKRRIQRTQNRRGEKLLFVVNRDDDG